MTEAQQKLYNNITDNFEPNETFTREDIKKRADLPRVPAQATINKLVELGVIISYDDGYYQRSDKEMGNISIAVDTKVSGDAVKDLFRVRETIESEINSVLHWVDSNTYATSPNSQKGIYKIVEAATDRILYVGQTGAKGNHGATFTSRWKQHRDELIAGTHHCVGLQEYFNTQLDKNIDNIRFEILEELPDDADLIDKRERYWIDYFGDVCLNTLRPSLIGKTFLTMPEITADKETKTEAGLKQIVSSVAKAIHEYMYASLKLSDYEKATLVAGIIIALNNESFHNTYRNIVETGEFMDAFQSGIKNSIRRYKGLKNGDDKIISEFNFIQHNEGFEKILTYKDKNYLALQFLTEIIEESIWTIAKRYPTYDVMGAFYSEFTNRSGADQQDLGVVMTPHHIADFMGDLLDITDDDIILDICCGTGSLLLAADNETQVANKMIGVEYQPRMMALTLANMIMRNADSSLYVGDSFNEEVLKLIKEEKPTKLIINPPYSQNGFPELGFVQRGLDCLQPGGLGVAIVPMSCAIKNDNATKNMKKAILQNHQLLATFSMPDQLFYPVGVVTIVMLFKAYSKEKSEAFFGYLKDDGFEITRTAGRADVAHKWSDIKADILNIYHEHTAIAGKSATAEVAYDDEWCCEAYMTTDYSNITPEMFAQEMRNLCIRNLWLQE